MRATQDIPACSVPAAVKQQRLALYFASFSFAGMVIWVGIRVYFNFIGNLVADRHFVLSTIGIFPFWTISWIVGFISAGNSIVHSRRITAYGAVALIMLAIPAIPVAIMTVAACWQFVAYTK